MMLQSFSSVICLVCFSMLQLRQASLALLPTGWQRPKKPCLSPSCNSSGSCGLLSCFLEGPRCHHLKNIRIWMCINYSTVWYLKRTLSKTRWYIITGVYNYEHRITYIYEIIFVYYTCIYCNWTLYTSVLSYESCIYIYIVSSSMCIVKHQLPSKAQRLRGAEAAAWGGDEALAHLGVAAHVVMVGRHGWNGGKCLQRWPKVEMSYIVSSKLHVMRSMSSGLLA